MTLRANHFYFLTFAFLTTPQFLAAIKPIVKSCGEIAALAKNPTEKSETFYRESDPNFPDFHFTGTLTADGTLKISTYRGLSDGIQSTINPKLATQAMLAHFGKKVKRVELGLSQLENIDDRNWSKEPLLDDFNRSWNEASRDPKLVDLERMVGKAEAKRDEQILSRAALGTSVGTTLMLSGGMTKVTMTSALGKRRGEWISIVLMFEPR